MDGDLPAVFGQVTESKRSGRVLVVTDEIGLREMELPQNFPGGVFFATKSCVRKFHETRAECLRELRVYILYMCVYTVNKGFVCSIAPGFYSHCQHECGGA